MESTTPGRETKYDKYQIINHPDHPSFKRRGNFFAYSRSTLKLGLTGFGGLGGKKQEND